MFGEFGSAGAPPPGLAAPLLPLLLTPSLVELAVEPFATELPFAAKLALFVMVLLAALFASSLHIDWRKNPKRTPDRRINLIISSP